MRETEPKVRIIGQMTLDRAEVASYLEDVGASRETVVQWRTAPSPDSEALVSFAGRLCYRSWEPGLNANVVMIRADRGEHVRNMLGQGHGSVLGHSWFSILFQDVSRVFTHELVRHRAGTEFSQESLRYVRLTDLGFRVPPVLEPFRELVERVVAGLERAQNDVAAGAGIDSMEFGAKKALTSAMRRLAPLGLSTSILMTANARALRWIIEARSAPGAEEEMRLVMDMLASKLAEAAPALFGDFERREDGSWTPAWSKV